MAAPAKSENRVMKDVVQGLGHVTLPVTDMVTALRFYTEVLQMEPAGHVMTAEQIQAAKAAGTIRAPHVSVRLGVGPRIDLFETDYPRTDLYADHPHWAFKVDGADLDLCAETLRAAEIPFDGPSRRGPAGGASLYFLDPFGNHLEYNCESGYGGDVEDRPPIWDKMDYSWP